MSTLRSTLTRALLLILLSVSPLLAAAPRIVRVVVLAGQSNMEGQAVVDLAGRDYNEGRGTLVEVLRNTTNAARFHDLRDARGAWAVRDSVWIRYQREDAPLLKGPLGIGYSVYGDSHHFGPELQLGHVLGDGLGDPVLLIKTAWGGKSLYRDFRPPSSGNPGPYYTRMIAEIREALTRLPQDFPALTNATPVLSGFVWYQGWNDGVDPQHAIPEYETNLVNLIHDVRREFQSPGLPVVIGELTGPWVDAPPEWTALRRAQAAAANRPEFQGSVVFVPTHTFVRRAEDSPNPGHGHHEFGNAETCLWVGDALGHGLLGLIHALPAGPGFETRRVLGWTAHLKQDLLKEQPEAVQAMWPLLEQQLREITRVVPQPALQRLQEIPLWFTLPPKGSGGTAEYHPGADWLRENGRDPAMAKGVQVSDVRDFGREVNRMPWFMLHELAHGYHDRVLGFDHPEVRAAYEAAKDGKRYDRVERWFGNGRPNTFERAYAMTNPQEYFAECSEAYFGRNDFFPFTRDDLKRHDPRIDVLLDQLWSQP
jgi:hypothetical protein